ncbi:hypothetical protein BN1050_02432 [Metalysinibacillus saudimassiliensis]|uniref:Uncharacterized protein n=1 Tax=Metalysinibacillus saudimassiliensis TaxID=1461583 RepID=A0A078MGC7_9BACL|nr:hypothetical protein BN1050_02432 [Metalysinibacillus saudimassiliensis]
MVARTAFRTVVLTVAMILFVPIIVLWGRAAVRD